MFICQSNSTSFVSIVLFWTLEWWLKKMIDLFVTSKPPCPRIKCSLNLFLWNEYTRFSNLLNSYKKEIMYKNYQNQTNVTSKNKVDPIRLTPVDLVPMPLLNKNGSFWSTTIFIFVVQLLFVFDIQPKLSGNTMSTQVRILMVFLAESYTRSSYFHSTSILYTSNDTIACFNDSSQSYHRCNDSSSWFEEFCHSLQLRALIRI